MSFPRINTKTKNFTLIPELEKTLEKRLLTLERVLPKNTEVLCDVELEKITEHHHAGKIYRAEILISFAGTVLRADACEETMEAAIDHAKGEMKRELERMQSKKESLFRRGARRAKDLFRFRN